MQLLYEVLWQWEWTVMCNKVVWQIIFVVLQIIFAFPWPLRETASLSFLWTVVFLANDILMYVDCKCFKQLDKNKRNKKKKNEVATQATGSKKSSRTTLQQHAWATLQLLARLGYPRTELLKEVLSMILRRGVEETLTIRSLSNPIYTRKRSLLLLQGEITASPGFWKCFTRAWKAIQFGDISTAMVV